MRWWTTATLSCLLFGCSPAEPAPIHPAVDAGWGTFRVTYHRDIRPLTEAQCRHCHFEAGPAPFPLETYDEVRAHAALVVAEVQARRMPPAQTDPDCRPVIRQHWLDDAQRHDFEQWALDGYPEGDPDDFVSDGATAEYPGYQLGPPDIIAPLPEPFYFQAGSVGDNYSIALLDYVFEEETLIVTTQVVPDDVRILHHAGIVLADESGEPLQYTEDEVELASHGLLRAYAIGGYFPGHPTYQLPEGTVFRVPAGSRLLLETHYHFNDWTSDEPFTDNPKVHIWTFPNDAAPTREAKILLAINADLDIVAGDPESVHTADIPLGSEPFDLIAVTPHMHYLGVAARMEILRNDAYHSCVVDTPNYDFEWQVMHRFARDDEVVVMPGDQARVTCIHDNSDENQPFIGGTQQRAVDVTFGTGSQDEMCIMYLLAAQPF
jgi:hypothetical protein